jgi:hypothetical protein
MIVKDSNDLLNFLIAQSEIAKYHADKMSPDEVVEYAFNLNESIYHKIIKTRP